MKSYLIRHFLLIFIFSLFLCVSTPLHSEDISQLGGELTTNIPGQNAIQVNAPNVTDDELRLIQLSGFAPFHRINNKSNGLGPRFINRSCAGCHVGNGKGRTRVKRKPKDIAMVVKVSLPGLLENGKPRDVPRVGEQLQHRNVRGKSRFKLRLRWRRVRGRYPDGTRYRLRRPLLRFRVRGYRPSQIVSSLRMTPALIGLGLLESIPEETILAMSDPDDANGDGISGRPQYILDKKTGERVLGRFGFRSSFATVEQQTGAAAFFDMGITNQIFPGNSGDNPELTDDQLFRLTMYQKLAGVPVERDQSNPVVTQGRELFKAIGCDSCHKMTLTTENETFPELDGQEIHPFTDMLLHDMGDGLADERPEFEASGREWRTTPLWGLGFASTISRVKINYLHDGRARTIEEAILWHGGEAAASLQAFKNLTKAERDALIAFLRSL